MGRKRKELLSSAPWRTGEAAEDEDAARMSREGKVSVTSNPGETPTMSVPRSRRPDLDLTVDDFEEDEMDPELRYSFQRNSRVPYTPTRPSFFFWVLNDFPCSCSVFCSCARAEVVLHGLFSFLIRPLAAVGGYCYPVPGTAAKFRMPGCRKCTGVLCVLGYWITLAQKTNQKMDRVTENSIGSL
jgi:hypothetical protein